MPTAILFPPSSGDDGYLESTGNATYLTARTMASVATTNTAGTTMRVGQRNALGNFFVSEAFCSWDTGTGVPRNAIITSAQVSLYGDVSSDVTTNDFTPECRQKTWRASGLTSADAVAGASLSGQTLLATFAATTSAWSSAGYNAFTESGSALRSAISRTGFTEVMFDSSKTTAGTSPGANNEYLEPNASDTAGTTKDPKLVVGFYIARHPGPFFHRRGAMQ